MKEFYEICKRLSKEVYNDNVPKLVDGWSFCEREQIQNMDIVSKGKVIKHLNLACTVYKKENDIILAFRGTNDALDFVTDSTFVAKRIPPSMTKAYNIYKRIRKKIQGISSELCADGNSFHAVAGFYDLPERNQISGYNRRMAWRTLSWRGKYDHMLSDPDNLSEICG